MHGDGRWQHPWLDCQLVSFSFLCFRSFVNAPNTFVGQLGGVRQVHPYARYTRAGSMDVKLSWTHLRVKCIYGLLTCGQRPTVLKLLLNEFIYGPIL